MKITVKNIGILIDKIHLDLIRDNNWYWNVWRHLQAKVNGKSRYLHRLIAERMGLNVNKRIYHKNRNTLDFRQSNLTDISSTQKLIRKSILIDKWNMDLIRDYTWYLNSGGYLEASIDGKTRLLHHIVAERMGLDISDQIDHIDRNRENNHESNLRLATRSQNAMNKKIYSNNLSGYIGVSWDKKAKKWRACIGFNKKQIHLGYFDDKIEAAHTRDRAAIKYFGEYANLNFPRSDYFSDLSSEAS